ncbi:MAG: hypothetical protein AAB681_01730 [Patescibacteria group bacterium]
MGNKVIEEHIGFHFENQKSIRHARGLCTKALMLLKKEFLIIRSFTIKKEELIPSEKSIEYIFFVSAYREIEIRFKISLSKHRSEVVVVKSFCDGNIKVTTSSYTDAKKNRRRSKGDVGKADKRI